jgi:RNA ligase (TIGR02306 family)
MSMFSVPVVRVGPYIKHENADSLSITQVLGCPVIFKTGTYNEGDLAIYVPVDSIVDTTVPELAFLQTSDKTRVRIKAKKLRGVFSMGLLIPAPAGATEGQDYAELLRIEKYEEPIPTRMSGECVKGPDGVHVPVYDLESLRTFYSLFIEGEEVVITEKIHGSNARFLVSESGDLYVGSRTQFKQVDGTTIWSRVARDYDLANKLQGTQGYVFYGEVFGNGVQDLTYGCKNGELKLQFFDIFDSRRGVFLSHDNMLEILNRVGLESAPVLYRGTIERNHIETLAEQDSVYGGIREGVVVRSVVERLSEHKGSMMRTVLKFVSQRYLLRKDGTEFH